MDKARGKGDRDSKAGTPPQAKEDSAKSRSGNAWIREDGAVCFDNECITLKSDADGAMALTYDPNKCSCDETNDTILKAIVSSAVSGKGVRLEIKPKDDPAK
jgi:hypothetical protein